MVGWLLLVVALPSSPAELAAPLAAQAPEPTIPLASAAGRGGALLIAAGGLGAPMAAVQIHVRLVADELAPAERRLLTQAAHAWAEGAAVGRRTSWAADVRAVGGATRVRVTDSSIVISVAAPAEQLALLLRTADERLRGRGRVQAGAARLPAAPSWAEPVDPFALSLALPGHPEALAVDVAGAAAAAPQPAQRERESAALRAVLERVLVRDRVVVVVVGAAPPTDVVAVAARTILAPLGVARPPWSTPPTLAVLADGTVVFEHDGDGDGARLWLLAPGQSQQDVEARAARAVLARLLGGVAQESSSACGLALDVTAARPSLLPRAEQARIDALVAVATTAPPAEVVSTLAAQQRAARLSALTDAEALAAAVGQAALLGDAALLERELGALARVTPEAVAAEARRLAAGPRVVRRSLRAPPVGLAPGAAPASATRAPSRAPRRSAQPSPSAAAALSMGGPP
jgi:hypothetical protein